MKLANYACRPEISFGRSYPNCSDSNDARLNFVIDRQKIIHSMAFRRLEYKTQVFVNHSGDHYRTRLTHTLEVANVTKFISRELFLNEDLAETIALAHDIGHPPFGHTGEEALQKITAQYGGFNHNLQTLKIITSLEQQYPDFDGLNLTWETLEGITKHNGPLIEGSDYFNKTSSLFGDFNLKLSNHPSLEAQVAALADDITYCNHDIDDGVRAGFFHIEELTHIDLFKEILFSVRKAYPNIDQIRTNIEALRRLKLIMIDDLLRETNKNIELSGICAPPTLNNIPNKQIVNFSPDMNDSKNQLKQFLMQRVYRHYQINRMRFKAKAIVSSLFKHFIEAPECLPPSWYAKATQSDEYNLASVVTDYIAGMTDRFAAAEYNKLFDITSI